MCWASQGREEAFEQSGSVETFPDILRRVIQFPVTDEKIESAAGEIERMDSRRDQLPSVRLRTYRPPASILHPIGETPPVARRSMAVNSNDSVLPSFQPRPHEGARALRDLLFQIDAETIFQGADLPRFGDVGGGVGRSGEL